MLDEEMSVMTDMTDGTRGRRPVPGTVGISIEVIEYSGSTGTFETVKTAAYAPPDSVDGEQVSLVRPFVLASLGEAKPGLGVRRRRPDGGN